MQVWCTKVDHIVSHPPGSDEGFTPEELEQGRKVNFERFSTWAIVCEEVLDTTYPRAYFRQVQHELERRGISGEEYQAMRRFAWLTAGWLNFEKMLWDWCSLDEDDIRLAIEWQYTEGWISTEERERRIQFMERFAKPQALS